MYNYKIKTSFFSPKMLKSIDVWLYAKVIGFMCVYLNEIV